MHLCMIIWLYRVPFGYRRRMKQKDIDYQNHLKKQKLLLKQSLSSPHLNSYFEQINNKDKFAVFITHDINAGNDLIKNRMAYL